jgi:hypothetical protein
MSDIVKRLRGWSRQGSPISSTDIYAMTQEAADEVEQLTAENENLREQIGLMTRIVELEFARRRRPLEGK